MSICPRYDCSINYSKANFDVFETLIRFVQLEPATVILGETDRDVITADRSVRVQFVPRLTLIGNNAAN